MTQLEKRPGIYKITNKINNKSYIGISRNVYQRVKYHMEHYKENAVNQDKQLYWAMNEFGIKNFTISILEYCSYEELAEKEIFYIKKYDSFKHGYNNTIGGDGIDEVKIKNKTLLFPEIPPLPKNKLFITYKYGIQRYDGQWYTLQTKSNWTKVFEKRYSFTNEDELRSKISDLLDVKPMELDIKITSSPGYNSDSFNNFNYNFIWFILIFLAILLFIIIFI